MGNRLAYPVTSAVEYLSLIDTTISAADINSLNPYLATAAEIHEALNTAQAPMILAKLSQGLSICASLVAAATFQLNQAKTLRRKTEALIALEEFPFHVASSKGKGVEIKVTDKTTTYFVDQHPEVVEARTKEDFYSALYEKLVINKNVLTMAISSAKAIAYGHRDLNMMTTSAIQAEDK
jgi:hypothetical protein